MTTQLALEQQGRSLKDFQHRWMLEFYGPRCNDFDSGCSCCLAWMGHDLVFYEVDSYTEQVMVVPQEKAWYDNRTGELVCMFVGSLILGAFGAIAIYTMFN
jgi:hypothetical protein